MKNKLIIFSTLLLFIAFGCKKTESITDAVMFYPNSFSPNNDGQNDWWQPYGCNITGDYSVKIYNKKDKLLFETHSFNTPWDGKVNREICPVDYYYYVVRYETIDGVKHKDTGMLQLIK